MGVRFEFDWKGDEFMKNRLEPAVDKAVGVAALTLSTAMSSSMPGAGAAVIGRTATGRNEYRPSNPGEPPGVRTNRLRGSITNERVRKMLWTAGTNVGSVPGPDGKKNDYPRMLEFGTSQMPARPWARPALAKSKDKMLRAFIRKAKSELGGGG